jgi:prophage regulatory protein
MKPHPQLTEDGASVEQASPHVPPPARLLRLPEVIDRVGLRRSAIYQRMSEGRFPKSRSLGPKCAVWVEAEIDAWIRSIADKPDQGAQ